ncbi:MAG: hypothetical protein KAJ14_10190, partial [Candidatus Omnitrophica bacterium]|nr:hypothetical protein [Candidatus Omnitrophota bacterium]
ICLNTPLPRQEACGTSDQRTGSNGGVNIAVKGAGPIEWINDYNEGTKEGNGFLLDSYTVSTPEGVVADNDLFYRKAPADIYNKTEIASRLYNNQLEEWKQLMHNSYTDANEKVTAKAMEARYALNVYQLAIEKRRKSLELSKSEQYGSKIISEMIVRDYYDKENKISGLRVAFNELQFLADSGVEYLYLLGIMKHTGRPFEIINPKDIDFRAGDFEDLERFINEAHRLGLKVIIDWLANQHIPKESPLCKGHPEWFLYSNVSDGNVFLEEGTKIIRGSYLSVDELCKRIDRGNKILSEIKKIERDNYKLYPKGILNINGELIPYKTADKTIRNKVSGTETKGSVVIVSEEQALFIVSATDEVPLRIFPRRWELLAQPDLSYSGLVNQALEIGSFWLAKGIDGFRVDAALSSFPNRIKENWGYETNTNLSHLFINKMRELKPDCFILFEGFHQQKDLLALANYRFTASYYWQARDLIISGLLYPDDTNNYGINGKLQILEGSNNFTVLKGFLKYLERLPKYLRDRLVSLSAEHDAYSFNDPWSKLDYKDTMLLSFIYTFLPGYLLSFNGQIFGKKHLYKNDSRYSQPGPQVKNALDIEKETGKYIFSLRKNFPKQLITGDYRVLETTDNEIICIARFDENSALIGIINPTINDKHLNINFKSLIESLSVSDINSSSIELETVLSPLEIQNIEDNKVNQVMVEKLLEQGLPVDIKKKSFKVIKLSMSIDEDMDGGNRRQGKGDRRQEKGNRRKETGNEGRSDVTMYRREEGRPEIKSWETGERRTENGEGRRDTRDSLQDLVDITLLRREEKRETESHEANAPVGLPVNLVTILLLGIGNLKRTNVWFLELPLKGILNLKNSEKKLIANSNIKLNLIFYNDKFKEWLAMLETSPPGVIMM